MNTQTLTALLTQLEDANLAVEEISDENLTALTDAIEASPFIESEGARLALNLVYLAAPERCVLIQLSDFVDGCITETLEKLGELSAGALEVKELSSNADLDWEAVAEDPETFESFRVTVTAKINGKRLEFVYPINEADDPMAAVETVLTALKDAHGELIEELVTTRTVDTIWDEAGAVLVCRLPQGIRTKLGELFSR